jgi:hypothetical protein
MSEMLLTDDLMDAAIGYLDGRDFGFVDEMVEIFGDD